MLIKQTRFRHKEPDKYKICPKCGKKGRYIYRIIVRSGYTRTTIGHIDTCRYCKHVFERKSY